MPDGCDAKLLQVSAVRLGRTVSSISFSRNAASYFPRPRLRSQTTTSMSRAHNQWLWAHHGLPRGVCPGGRSDPQPGSLTAARLSRNAHADTAARSHELNRINVVARTRPLSWCRCVTVKERLRLLRPTSTSTRL